jgi:hypothetical protein
MNFDPHELEPPGFLTPGGRAVPPDADDPFADFIARTAEHDELWRVLIVVAAAVALVFVWTP